MKKTSILSIILLSSFLQLFGMENSSRSPYSKQLKNLKNTYDKVIDGSHSLEDFIASCKQLKIDAENTGNQEIAFEANNLMHRIQKHMEKLAVAQKK